MADLKGTIQSPSKNLHLCADKINGREGKGGTIIPSTSCRHSLPNSTDVTVVTTKKETFGECERNDEMKKQERTALVVEGCRQVGSFGGFFLFLSLLESSAPLVPCSLVHNSSSVNHGSLSQSEKEGANSTPKGPHSLSFLCLISLFEFKSSFLFWFYSSDHDQN